MESVQMFFGGLILGPLFAVQAGLAWYIVVAIIRIFGHWISIILPPLSWGVWPLLRIGYVLLLGILLFGYLNGSSGAQDRPQMLAAMVGVAASFAVALFLRHRGWRWFAGRKPSGLSTPVYHGSAGGSPARDLYAGGFPHGSPHDASPGEWSDPPTPPCDPAGRGPVRPGGPSTWASPPSAPPPSSWESPPGQPSWGSVPQAPSPWEAPPDPPSWSPQRDTPRYGPPPTR